MGSFSNRWKYHWQLYWGCYNIHSLTSCWSDNLATNIFPCLKMNPQPSNIKHYKAKNLPLWPFWGIFVRCKEIQFIGQRRDEIIHVMGLLSWCKIYFRKNCNQANLQQMDNISEPIWTASPAWCTVLAAALGSQVKWDTNHFRAIQISQLLAKFYYLFCIIADWWTLTTRSRWTSSGRLRWKHTGNSRGTESGRST